MTERTKAPDVSLGESNPEASIQTEEHYQRLAEQAKACGNRWDYEVARRALLLAQAARLRAKYGW